MLHLHLLVALAPQGAVIPTQPALVEVKSGRAQIIGERGSRLVTSRDEPVLARGSAHLEVAAGSVVVVSWRGRATLRFEGPSAFEWGAGETGGELFWRAIDVSSLDAEVRRGSARLELPMGWFADMQTGAYHLRSLSNGSTRIDHSAGEPVRITWVGSDNDARPPAFLEPGQWARLDSPPPVASPPDKSASAPAWSGYNWPWGEHGVPGRPDLGHGPAWSAATWPFGTEEQPAGEPWAEVEWPWQPMPAGAAPLTPGQPAEGTPREPVEAGGWGHSASADPELSVEATESTPEVLGGPPKPVPVAPSEHEAPQAGASTPSGVEAAQAADPSIEAPAAVDDLKPAVAETQVPGGSEAAEGEEPAPQRPEPSPIQRSGPLRYYANQGLVIEELLDGQWRAVLAEDATEPAQILGGRFDIWILPGGEIRVDEEGALLYHLGEIEVRPSSD